jgi:hypothetical protein
MRLIFDNTDVRSLSSRFRKIRLSYFLDFLSKCPSSITILDVGGAEEYWINLGYVGDENVKITILNLDKPVAPAKKFDFVQGDVRNMSQLKDGSFDIVFSNSTVEHLGTFAEQMMAAKEIRRVGKGYFIQTPNYYFPIEPHFLVPFFQFLPIGLRIFMLMHFNLGWISRKNSKQEAREIITRIKLLKRIELAKMFPDGDVFREKCFFLTKSYIFYKFPVGTPL